MGNNNCLSFAGVREFDTLCLRFKYYAFYDLDTRHDAVRINLVIIQYHIPKIKK